MNYFKRALIFEKLTYCCKYLNFYILLIIIIIEGLSLLQSIPPTTADKQTQAQKRRSITYILLCSCKYPMQRVCF